MIAERITGTERRREKREKESLEEMEQSGSGRREKEGGHEITHARKMVSLP